MVDIASTETHPTGHPILFKQFNIYIVRCDGDTEQPRYSIARASGSRRGVLFAVSLRSCGRVAWLYGPSYMECLIFVFDFQSNGMNANSGVRWKFVGRAHGGGKSIECC